MYITNRDYLPRQIQDDLERVHEMDIKELRALVDRIWEHVPRGYKAYHVFFGVDMEFAISDRFDELY